MKFGTKFWLANAVAVLGAFLLLSMRSTSTIAQPAEVREATASAKRTFSTQVVTLKFEADRGEPKAVAGRAKFDRNVEACWVSVVGADIKFTHSTEKQINRQLFDVDPYGKVINGREVEVSGKLGIRDGSGNWDDTYEGTITVAITAVLSGE